MAVDRINAEPPTKKLSNDEVMQYGERKDEGTKEADLQGPTENPVADGSRETKEPLGEERKELDAQGGQGGGKQIGEQGG
jgi:hypothetical protein